MLKYQRCLLSKYPTTSLINILAKASTFNSSLSHRQRRNLSKDVQKPRNIALFVSRNRPSFLAPQTSAVKDEEDDTLLNSLTNRGDFYGVNSTKLRKETPVSIETAISNLQTYLDKNQRISGEFFVRTVLLPLESKDPDILNMLKFDSASYVPFFIRCCGIVMSDVTETQRLQILERLLQSFKKNGINSDENPFGFVERSKLFPSLLKSCQLDGADLRILEALKTVMQPGYHYYGRDQQLQLFESLFQHPKIDFLKAVKFCNEMVNLRLIRNRNVFLEVAAYYLTTNMSYQNAFDYWKSACSDDNTVAGGNVFMERVLSDRKLPKFEAHKRIKELVQFYEKVKSPNDAIAQLILSLISTGRYMDAKVLWLRFQVQPKFFINPVRILKNCQLVEVNTIHIHEFAQLLEECVLVELKRKKKSPKKNPVNTIDEEISATKPAEPDYGDMEFMIKYWQPGRTKKYGKRPKLKKFQVSPDQLERLLLCIEEVKKKLAEATISSTTK